MRTSTQNGRPLKDCSRKSHGAKADWLKAKKQGRVKQEWDKALQEWVVVVNPTS